MNYLVHFITHLVLFPGFLNKNPADRLGCNRESGFVEIMTHAFFKTIDWALLEQKQIPPPYRPRLESERDLANFPPEFTDEPVHLTPDDPGIIGTMKNRNFMMTFVLTLHFFFCR